MSRPKQATSSHRSQYSVAELFCGCGGFSRGFEMTGRFHVVFGNDVKPFALRTFELNHTRGDDAPVVLRQDIRTVSDREIACELAAALLRQGFGGCARRATRFTPTRTCGKRANREQPVARFTRCSRLKETALGRGSNGTETSSWT